MSRRRGGVRPRLVAGDPGDVVEHVAVVLLAGAAARRTTDRTPPGSRASSRAALATPRCAARHRRGEDARDVAVAGRELGLPGLGPAAPPQLPEHAGRDRLRRRLADAMHQDQVARPESCGRWNSPGAAGRAPAHGRGTAPCAGGRERRLHADQAQLGAIVGGEPVSRHRGRSRRLCAAACSSSQAPTGLSRSVAAASAIAPGAPATAAPAGRQAAAGSAISCADVRGPRRREPERLVLRAPRSGPARTRRRVPPARRSPRPAGRARTSRPAAGGWRRNDGRAWTAASRAGFRDRVVLRTPSSVFWLTKP